MTLKKLKKIQPYITDYSIEVSQKDVDIANKAIKKMYRKPKQMAAGDIVEFTTPYGEFSKRAIIERIDGDDVHICQHGSAWCTSSKKYISVSGGSFYHVNKSELFYLGRDKRYFGEWGSCGACASGAISVPVTVNVWRNKSDLEYTTEFYTQHFINPISEEYQREHNCRYSWQSSYPHQRAWVNNEELCAWMVLNKAFIDGKKISGNGYNTIVWSFKRYEQYWCKDEEVLKMNGFHDFEIMNGAVRNVCYVYDSDNKSVTVYYGNDDVSNRNADGSFCRDWDSRKYENTLRYVRENKLHFPESFIKG